MLGDMYAQCYGYNSREARDASFRHEQSKFTNTSYAHFYPANLRAMDELKGDIETLRKAIRHIAEYNGVEYDELIKEVKEKL